MMDEGSRAWSVEDCPEALRSLLQTICTYEPKQADNERFHSWCDVEARLSHAVNLHCLI